MHYGWEMLTDAGFNLLPSHSTRDSNSRVWNWERAVYGSTFCHLLLSQANLWEHRGADVQHVCNENLRRYFCGRLAVNGNPHKNISNINYLILLALQEYLRGFKNSMRANF